MTNIPGLDRIRNAVYNRLWTRLPRWPSLRRDAIAGLSNAISNVPDGMADGALLGVSPVHGLDAAMVGPAVAGCLSSTQLMMVTTTTAASVAAAQALGGLRGQARLDALIIMTFLIGSFQLAAAVLRLERLLRFVSYSVTAGFVAGVSILLILNQLPVVTGHGGAGGAAAIGILRELESVDPPSLGLAALTFALAVILPRTRLGRISRLIAVVVPSLIVQWLGLDQVRLVRQVGDIPRGIPLPRLPPLAAVTPHVVTGAAAVMIIMLVQSAGVNQSTPNPDGALRSRSRDFAATGAANLVCSLVQGLPVGGSISATALNVLYGGQSRWAAIFAGIFMAMIIGFLAQAVGFIAMPSLGALLILAGVSSLRLRDIWFVIETGWPSRLAAGATFIAMLFLPIQAAVAIGVGLSAFLYLNSSSTDVSLVELVEHGDGRVEERSAPKTLSSRTVTVLDVYGALFFAGARTLHRLLPRPMGAERPVVVLRLRSVTSVGATLLDVLSSYAKEVASSGGRLYLTGVDSELHDQITRTHHLDLSGPVTVLEATPMRGESTRRAVAESKAWLVGNRTARS